MLKANAMNARQAQNTRTSQACCAGRGASIVGGRITGWPAQGLFTVAALAITLGAQAQTSSTPAVAPAGGKNATGAVVPLLDELGQRLDVPQSVLGFGGSAVVSANASPGVGALDTLPGNGTGSGYTLSHSGIVAASVSLYAGGRRLLLGQDYWLDADGGTLFFAAPVRASDTIRVSYRWLPDAAPHASAAMGLGLSLSDKTRLNLLVGQNTRPADGLSLALNGLRLNSAFGQKDASHYAGLAYFADTRRSANATLSWRDVMNDAVKAKPAAIGPAALPASGHLLSQSLGLAQNGLRLSLDYQDVTQKFAGFAGLKQSATGDKAALDQLARLEKEQGLRRLGFGVGVGGGASDKTPHGLSFAWNQIEDAGDPNAKTTPNGAVNAKPAQAVTRQTLGYDTSRFHFALSSQSVTSGFTRLNDLGDAEKAALGKSAGLKREQMSLLWQPDKATKIGFERLHVGATSEAVGLAVAQATKDNKDDVDKSDQAKKIEDARLKAAGGAERDSFHLELKGLKFAANQTQTDKTFTRAGDLGLADADKQALDRDKGYASKDVSLRFDGLKGLLLDNYAYTGESVVDKLRHDIARRSVVLTPSKSLTFTYSADHDLTTSRSATDTVRAAQSSEAAKPAWDDKTQAGSAHTILAFKDLLTKTVGLSAQHDITRLLDKGKETQATAADTLALGMPKDKRGMGLDYTAKRIAFANGKYDNTVEFNIHAKPTDALTVQIARRDIDRQVDDKDTKPEDKKDGVLSTESVELDFQAAKNFTFVFGQSQTDVLNAPKTAQTDIVASSSANDATTTAGVGKTDGSAAATGKPIVGLTDSNTVTVGLKTDPGRNITIAAKFDETHDDGKNTRELADISIGNAKPVSLGPLRELSIKAGYASLNDKRQLQNETMTGHAAWKLWKHEFLLDYGGFSKLDGKTLNETTSRTYSFKSDPAPARWFHGSFLYKVRTLADGKDYLVRKFGADALLYKRTRLVYSYSILPENDKGEMQPTQAGELALTHALSPRNKLSLFYRMNTHQPELLGKPDPTTSTWTRAVGIGYESAVGAKGKWGLALSRESNGYGLFSDHSDRLRLSYERQMGNDNFVSLATEYRTHDGKDADGKDLHGEARATLDFSRHF